ncbi:MAG: AEC family transporter [Eubacteriales bacterium]|nr:AEC family transporter [Eubacteriales bacterium]
MQISLILLQEIARLFLILLMGWAVVKLGLLTTADSRVLSVVMVYLVTPCVIIDSFQVDYDPQVVRGLLFAFALAVGAHALLLLLSRLFARPLRLDVIERCTVVYTNAGILVIPLVEALLGAEYVMYSCAFMVVQQVLIWTHCRSLLCGTQGMDWKKIVCNVNIVAIAIGAALFVLRVPLPTVIGGTLSTTGSLLGPLGMLLSGMVIADAPLGELFLTPRNYVAVALRLLVCPVLTVLLFRALGVAGWLADGKAILMTVYLACISPACATVTSLAQLYDSGAARASALYVLSTLLSVVTMPLMIGVFDMLL